MIVCTTVTKVTGSGGIVVIKVAGDGVELAGGGGGGGGGGDGRLVNGKPAVEVEDGRSGSIVARLLEALATLAVDNEDSTLSAELVAEKSPEISVGVVPASDMVGVVGRPCALEVSLLTELVLAAGRIDESALDGGTHPELSW